MSLDDPQALLDAAYGDLDFLSGDLYEATDAPGGLPTEVWVERGGWLSLAKRVGADKVFFVENNPVIIFSKTIKPSDSWKHAYNQVWCMARPPLLFFAQPGELTVLDLTCPPVRDSQADDQINRVLDTARRTVEVQSLLKKYHRSQIESGRLFEEKRFGFDNRADHALIRDLGKVREALLEDNLSMEHAHALVGRSIFVRYLEDRGILTEEYFRRRVAKQNAEWHRILDRAPIVEQEEPKGRRLYYAAILSDKTMTDELFDRLAEDFNGDLFPFDRGERAAFTPSRLSILRRFLLGEIEDRSLFFFAYNFEIIPIELISSIYEEFLKVERGKSNTQGSFYTPIALVDFVLSRVLTPQMMDSRPRIMDPSCGSAIFLVEAFRRLIRHRRKELDRPLTRDEIRGILRDQIAGIDVNPEAIRVAAFSLYLAMLHYLNPPDILNNLLPNLTYSSNRERIDPSQHFDILLAANTFDINESVKEDSIRDRFTTGSADIIVGNPPWGEPKENDEETRKAAAKVLSWCETNERKVGDKELSQAFIQKTLDLLRTGGRAGLLVSTGVFFKRHPKSREFRAQWLSEVALDDVVNFAAVRHVFFKGGARSKGAVAPFASVVFEKRVPTLPDHRFQYYSAKETAFINELQAVLLRKPDLHIGVQAHFAVDDDLWKVYWWGGHRDEALVNALRIETSLGSIVDPGGIRPELIGEGIKVSRKRRKPTKVLHTYKLLPTTSFHRYGKLPTSSLQAPPDEVERERNPAIYEGCRLLIKRGISQKGGMNGQIIARLEDEPFCFRHSIYGIRLIGDAEAAAKILLGIAWSSLTRYFAWLTAGSWGMWHHEILKETIVRLPVRLTTDARLHARIATIVDELRGIGLSDNSLIPGDDRYPLFATGTVRELEQGLDEAVFDLFGLTEVERDLVCDMCEVGLEFFYAGMKSEAIKPIRFPTNPRWFGRRSDIPREREGQQGLDGYIDAFLELWEKELEPDGCFQWHVVHPSRDIPMLAVIFASEEKRDPLPPPSATDEMIWSDLLRRLSSESVHPFGSRRIYIDGMMRSISENEIVIIKQDERRLWTRSAAREDAEATLLDAIHRQQLNSPANE